MNRQLFLQQPSPQRHSRKRPQSPTEATPCKRLVTESMVASELKRLSLESETSRSPVDNDRRTVSFSGSSFVNFTPSTEAPSKSLIREDTPHPEKWARLLEDEEMKKSMEFIEVKEDSDNEADVSDLEENDNEVESVQLPMEYRLGEKKGRVPRFLLRNPRSFEQAILNQIPERSLILYKPFTWGSILKGILPPTSNPEMPRDPTSKTNLETGMELETRFNVEAPEEEDMDVDMELDEYETNLGPEMAPAEIKQEYMDL